MSRGGSVKRTLGSSRGASELTSGKAVGIIGVRIGTGSMLEQIFLQNRANTVSRCEVVRQVLGLMVAKSHVHQPPRIGGF